MLLELAWKNIWRNKVRSGIVLGSVILGLWVGAFMMAYSFGMMNQRLKDAVENEVSHFQIHNPDFGRDKEAKYFIENGAALLNDIENNDQIKTATARVITMGMVTSPKVSTGAQLMGILPEKESQVTGLSDKISEGEYLTSKSKNKAVIGKKLAEKLKVKLRSKIVLSFPDEDGDIIAGAFRIIGIYESYNKGFEEMNLYVNAPDLANLLEIPNKYHEIAALVNDSETLDKTAEELTQNHPDLKTETWKELAPELGLMIESADQYLVIFLVIILLALSFGIVNTMLMAVLERVREIGMLMAIGMNKGKVFGMIFFETLMLVLIAAPIGLFAAYLTISYLGEVGMDLSGVYDEGYASLGFKSFIYPALDGKYYLQIMYLVVIAAVLSSLYPAWTAIRMKPVEAMRKI